MSNPAGIDRMISPDPGHGDVDNFTHVTRAIYLIGLGHIGKIALPTEVQLPAVNKAWRILP